MFVPPKILNKMRILYVQDKIYIWGDFRALSPLSQIHTGCQTVALIQFGVSVFL